MAVNLSISTTLSLALARVRDEVGAVSVQDSMLLEPDLIDVVHNAVLTVRKKYGQMLDALYSVVYTTITPAGTTPNYSADISAAEISSVESVSVYSATLGGKVPILSNLEFDHMRTLYSAAEVGNLGVAAVSLEGSTYGAMAGRSKVRVRIWSNYGSAPTDVEVTMMRSPRYVTTAADTLDIPDQYVDEVIFAAVAILKARGK